MAWKENDMPQRWILIALPRAVFAIVGGLIGNGPVAVQAQEAAQDESRDAAGSAATGAAGVDILANQRSSGNRVIDTGGLRETTIVGSGNAGAGIIAINQSAGDGNNQGNIAAIALTMQAADMVVASTIAEMRLDDNQVVVANPLSGGSIIDSFNSATGLVQINQTAGHLNQQLNIFTMVLGANEDDGVAALADGALAAVTGANSVAGPDQSSDNGRIEGSFTDFSGVAQISQVSGHLNRVVNTLAVSLTLHDGTEG